MQRIPVTPYYKSRPQGSFKAHKPCIRVKSYLKCINAFTPKVTNSIEMDY